MLQADVLNNYWLGLLELPTFNKFFEGDEVAATLPVRLIDFAYEGDPREAETDIYAVGDHEYLVPVECTWSDGRVVESKVRLDRTKKIEIRPINDNTGQPTKIIPEMKLSDDVSPEVRETLLEETKRRYRNKPTHKAVFIVPEPR